MGLDVRFTTAPGLLLDVFDLHDRDRIVSFLTAERGKLRGVTRGARRKHSRFAGQLQPLSKVSVSWVEREGRDLVRITGVELLRPARRLTSTLEGILLGGYLADHMLQFAQENEASDALFRLLDSCLEALENGADLGLAARYYETWVLRLSGIFPPPRECPLCGRALAPGEGAVLGPSAEALLCASCGGEGPGAVAVSPQALEFLRRTAREGLAAMAARPTEPPVLAEIEALTGRVRRAFLGHELRSYGVLRQTLGDAGLGP